MIELLQERASLYVSGAMTKREREEFELILECHEEVRRFVNDLQDVGIAILLSRIPSDAPGPPPQLKSRILQAIAEQPERSAPEGLVMTGPDRLVQWVNPAFMKMCGYSLEELRGKNLGPILQGEKTDPAAIARIRRAVHVHRPCRETMINYHKNGLPYGVDVAITPILDDAGLPLAFVAREREVALPLAA